MRCEREKCACGNTEIAPEKMYYVTLGARRVPVPYCKKAIEEMEKENAAYPKQNQWYKKKGT
jgi:hypothetical protein